MTDDRERGTPVVLGEEGESAVLLAQAQALARFGVWESDVTDGVLRWSVETYRIFGVEPGVPVSFETFGQLVHPDDRERIVGGRGRLIEAGGAAEVEHRIVRPDGEVRWLSSRMSTVRDASGKPTKIIGVVQDVTARHQAQATLRATEEQLRVAQKLEAIGRLAGGVAHDFNNLLTIILSLCSVLGRRLPADDSAARTDLREIELAAERAAALTRQLLAFGRKQVLKPRLVHLGLTLLEMEQMLRRLVGEDIEVTLDTSPSLPHVHADAAQIEQVLMNLVVNARDAMPDGGKLTIATRAFVVDAAYAATHLGIPPGTYVRLAVGDTGSGMDETTRSQIFEPFFSTKGDLGTGLGLATVFGIVKQSGGWIFVESAIGKGTTFEILLPPAQEQREARRPPSRSKLLAVTGKETVLVCEDDAQVRTVVADALRTGGYHVLDAASPGDALLLAEQHDGPIHLLLTDVVMPRLGGRKLAERITASRADTRVLYMSGYTDDAIVSQGVLEAGVSFLEKPITPVQLLAKVREVLDS